MADIHHSPLSSLGDEQLTVRRQQLSFPYWLKLLNLQNVPSHLTAVTKGAQWKPSSQGVIPSNLHCSYPVTPACVI